MLDCFFLLYKPEPAVRNTAATLTREDTDSKFSSVFGDSSFEPFVVETPSQPETDERYCFNIEDGTDLMFVFQRCVDRTADERDFGIER